MTLLLNGKIVTRVLSLEVLWLKVKKESYSDPISRSKPRSNAINFFCINAYMVKFDWTKPWNISV